MLIGAIGWVIPRRSLFFDLFLNYFLCTISVRRGDDKGKGF